MKVLDICYANKLSDTLKAIWDNVVNDASQTKESHISEKSRGAKLMLKPILITQADDIFYLALKKFLGEKSPECIFALGDLDILGQKALALFPPVKCAGDLILRTYDLS